ncbi:hypothetical protein FH972_011501 [Carpinus fangiana]|uniref:Metallothionein-like protein n=1 Tax=Carpinus fangiana TaxID=176857 RepID=A0A660KRI3_9ROSI|nr:hypothetical protein FH972_011501 [Carpinus fangiana]
MSGCNCGSSCSCGSDCKCGKKYPDLGFSEDTSCTMTIVPIMKGLGVRALKQGTASAATATHASAAANEQKGEDRKSQ